MILFGVCKYFDSECKHIINCSKSKSDSLECTVGRFVNKEVVKIYFNDLTSKAYIPFYDKLWKEPVVKKLVIKLKVNHKQKCKGKILRYFENGICTTCVRFWLH